MPPQSSYHLMNFRIFQLIILLQYTIFSLEWIDDPRSGKVLQPFQLLPPQSRAFGPGRTCSRTFGPVRTSSRTFGPGKNWPCLVDQLLPRVQTKKNDVRFLPGLDSTHEKCYYQQPVETVSVATFLLMCDYFYQH